MTPNHNSKIKAIIIDDDLPSIEILSQAIGARDDIEICGTAESPEEGERLLSQHEPDILFLDMTFPNGDGLSWYEEAEIPERTKVVFYTCYQRYIHDALSLQVFDFLLKPFDPSELDLIIERYKRLPKPDTGEKTVSPSTAGNQTSTMHGRRKLISFTSVVNSKIIINPDDIIYFRYSSERKLWECVSSDLKRIILKRQTTADTILGYGPDFVRTHKHFIVNVRYVGVINGNDCILLPPFDNIDEIKISKSYRRDMLDRFYDI